jgi:catalase
VHQTAGGGTPGLTTQQGIPVADDQNSLKIGARGPTALEDFHLREKLFHFDHLKQILGRMDIPRTRRPALFPNCRETIRLL